MNPVYLPIHCRTRRRAMALELESDPYRGIMRIRQILTTGGAGAGISVALSPGQIDWSGFRCPACGDTQVVQCSNGACRALMCYPVSPSWMACLVPFPCPACGTLHSMGTSGQPMSSLTGMSGAGQTTGPGWTGGTTTPGTTWM